MMFISYFDANMNLEHAPVSMRLNQNEDRLSVFCNCDDTQCLLLIVVFNTQLKLNRLP